MGKQPKSDQLIKKYEQLPQLHQQIMQCKAVCYKLHRKGDFANAIQRSALRTDDGKRLYSKHLNPILDQLVRSNLLDKQFNCHQKILHPLTRRALNPNSEQRALTLAVLSNLLGYHERWVFKPGSDMTSAPIDQLRMVHVAVHKNDESIFLTHTQDRAYGFRLLFLVKQLFYDEALEMEWLSTRKPAIQTAICLSKLSCYFSPHPTMPADITQWLQYYKNNPLPPCNGVMQYLAWQVDLGLGLLDHVKHSLAQQQTLTETMLVTQATLYFLYGNYPKAQLTYETALKAFRKRLNKRTWFFDDLHGICYLIVMIAVEHNPQKALRCLRALSKQGVYPDVSFLSIEALAVSAQHQRDQSLAILPDADDVINGRYPMSLYAPALQALVAYWINDPAYPDHKHHLVKGYQTYKTRFPLLAYCYAGLLQQLHHDTAIDHDLSKSPFKNCRLHQLMTVKPAWEYQLNRLTVLMGGPDQSRHAAFVGQKRLVWLLNPQAPSLEVMEQKRNASGNWSAGRAIALKRFASRDPKLDYLTAQDWEAVQGLQREYRWHGQDTYHWDLSATLPKLVGHPLIFHRQNPSVPIELVKGSIELHIEETQAGYVLELSARSALPGIQLHQDSPHRYRVIEFTAKDVDISQLRFCRN